MWCQNDGFVGSMELVACYINELLLGAGLNGFNKFNK